VRGWWKVVDQASARRVKDEFAPRGVRPGVLLMLLVWPLVAASVSCARLAGDETAQLDAKSGDAVGEKSAVDLEQQWGIAVASIRLTAQDHMIDYRYRVLDSEKATDLFKRQIKPYLIHQKTDKVLAVPETAKLGPLRNSNIPQDGRIYWMFFGNANNLVKAGDKVTVVIGEFRVEDLVVQ
jgi:hypothetical protein